MDRTSLQRRHFSCCWVLFIRVNCPALQDCKRFSCCFYFVSDILLLFYNGGFKFGYFCAFRSSYSTHHFWEFPRPCYHFQALETFKFEYVADRPAGLLVFAFSTSSFVEIFPISYSMPYFSHFQFVLNALGSSLFLVVLAVERYYLILKSFVHMKKVGKSLMWKVTLKIWF